jgi:hypothetical protein
MADQISQLEIDKIKEAARERDAKVDNFIISGGHGINVSGKDQSWEISFDENIISSLFKKITIQVCVDGEQKSLDVFVAGDPY